MESRNGGRWSFRRYRKQTRGSSSHILGNGNGSSSSGTIVSTAYTSTGSHRSSTSVSVEAAAAMHHLDKDNKQQVKQLIESLVVEDLREDFHIPNIIVKQRWFTELGIGWLLHLADGASSGSWELHAHCRSWMLAFSSVMDTIPLTVSQDDIVFAALTGDAISKMLTFVDVIASHGLPVSYAKLSALLSVHGALSKALPEIQLLFPLNNIVFLEDFGRTERQVAGLLSAKKGKAGEAIWDTMEEYKNRILALQLDGENNEKPSGGAQAPQGSSDIHKASQSVKRYIMLLQANYESADAVVSEAATLGKYVPLITDISPLHSMVVEMTQCLEEKLVSMSESFSDQGLRFLFLLNNSHFMLEELNHQGFWIHKSHAKDDLDFKVKSYMKSYVQESWAPVVSCLFDPVPLSLLINYNSPLLRFESKFQKTYTTQKHWKAPDPMLRNGLRKAITERIIPGYTKYIADNNIATVRFTPQELEEMLQELFEG